MDEVGVIGFFCYFNMLIGQSCYTFLEHDLQGICLLNFDEKKILQFPATRCDIKRTC